MSTKQSKTGSISPHFWLLTVYLVFVFLLGGSSRNDTQSLVILQPLSIIMCGVALVTIRREHLYGNGWIAALLGVIFLVIFGQLVPLPASISTALPGRAVVTEIVTSNALGNIWLPLTLVSTNSWQSVTALCAPLAVFLIGIQLDRNDVQRLLHVMVALGITSAIFGLLQVIGSQDGPFYLYDITSNGHAVGLFANRNHAAAQIACLFPMLAIYAASNEGGMNRQKGKLIVTISIAIILVPLVLITGSRTGTLLAVVGILGASALMAKSRSGRTFRGHGMAKRPAIASLLAVFFVLSVAVLAVLFSRAESIDRFASQSNVNDIRLDYWRISIDSFRGYFPIGSGAGSFAETFLIGEPVELLSNTYLNRAHNDWLETVITLGLPGIGLLLFILIVYLKRMASTWRMANGHRSSAMFAPMASVIIAMLAIASFTDYPLRTTSMMCFLMVATLWLNAPFASSAARSDEAISSA